jgi:hypothetical protein
MDQPGRLFLYCRYDGRRTVSGILAADAAREIEEPVSVDILDRHTIRALHEDW